MKFIAINTAAETEVLLCADKDYYFSSYDKTLASALLLPHIDIMLTKAGLTLNDLDAFACVVGPGSFTGIRIAVSTVRAFGYALNKPVLPVTYFDVLSAGINRPHTIAINGGGGVAYVKNYVQNLPPVCVRNHDIKAHSDGEIIGDTLFDPAITAEAEKGEKQLKKAVENAISQNAFVSFDRLVPLYLRRSQAERQPGEV